MMERRWITRNSKYTRFEIPSKRDWLEVGTIWRKDENAWKLIEKHPHETCEGITVEVWEWIRRFESDMPELGYMHEFGFYIEGHYMDKYLKSPTKQTVEWESFKLMNEYQKSVVRRMIDQIDVVEKTLESLLSICEEAGNFGSFYPLEAIEKLKTMRFIMQTNLEGIHIGIEQKLADVCPTSHRIEE